FVWCTVSYLCDSSVEKRGASLYADRHTRLIHLHHVIVRKLVPRFEEPHRLKKIFTTFLKVSLHHWIELRKLAAIAPSGISSVKLEKSPHHWTPPIQRCLEHRIPTKYFVRTLPYQNNFDSLLAAFLVKQSSRDCSPVCKEVVEIPDNVVEAFSHFIRLNRHFNMVRAYMISDYTRMRAFVHAGVSESHRYRCNLCMTRSQRGNNTRIDPPRQQQPHRYVGDKVLCCNLRHGVVKFFFTILQRSHFVF